MMCKGHLENCSEPLSKRCYRVAREGKVEARSLSFTVPGEPRGKGRPRIVRIAGAARMATDKATARYENLVALAARQALAGQALLEGALALTVKVRMVPAQSASKTARFAMLRGETWPTKKPDLDNVIKAVLDGCNAVAFRDDVLICRLTAEKVYAEEAGVDVAIVSLAP
jgi:Holliday junction resolvase RusA-like endonuclease